MRALEPYRIWLRYDDGVEGEVDLSHLAGKGVFAPWKDPAFFAGVYIGSGGWVGWSEDLDLCGDALYMEITGITPEEMFPEWFDGAGTRIGRFGRRLGARARALVGSRR